MSHSSTPARNIFGLRWATMLSAVASVVAVALIATFTGPATAIRSTADTSRIDHTLSSKQGTLTSRVSGETAGGRDVSGVFVPHSFQVRKGGLFTTGVLKGSIAGKGDFKRQVTMQVRRVDGSSVVPKRTMSGRAACEILDLTIRPIDLNLLGLAVHLDRVHLNITANSGSGNLLGNLLCAVAGLLDQGGALSNLLDQLSALLNQILGRLNL